MKTALLSAALAVVLTGCGDTGPRLHPVRGKVLSQGKTPATGAVVIFHPKDQLKDLKAVRPSGVVNEQGEFTLSWGTRSGAPTGEYLVTLTWPEKPTTSGKPKLGMAGGHDEHASPVDRLKGSYNDQNNPKFTRTVKEGVNELEPFLIP